MVCTWYIWAFCSWNGEPLFRSSFLHLEILKRLRKLFTGYDGNYLCLPLYIPCFLASDEHRLRESYLCVYFFRPCTSTTVEWSPLKVIDGISSTFRMHQPLNWMPLSNTSGLVTNKQTIQPKPSNYYQVWSLKSVWPERECAPRGLFAAGCNFVPRVDNFPKSLSPGAVESWCCQLFAWWCSVVVRVLYNPPLPPLESQVWWGH